MPPYGGRLGVLVWEVFALRTEYALLVECRGRRRRKDLSTSRGRSAHNPPEPAEMSVNDLTRMLYFDALQITRRNSPRTIFRVGSILELMVA